MIALSEHRLLRLVVLCALYTAQGIPFGFLTITLATYLAGEGLDSAAIGAIAMAATIPWGFKWVWGPFVDRFGSTRFGRRRPWILAAQTGMIGTLAAMATIPDPAAALPLLTWLVIAHNVFNSLQDVCVDALAVDLLPPEDRGKASGFMYGSKYIGTAIGGAGLSLVVDGIDLRAAFIAMIILIAAIGLLPLLTRERPAITTGPVHPHDSPGPEADAPSSVIGLLLAVAAAFARPPAIFTAIAALLATTASGLLSPIGTVLFVQELGWTEVEYATMTGGAAVLAGLGGAVGGGLLADAMGPRRVVAGCSLLLGGLLMSFAWMLETPLLEDRGLLWSYTLLESALLGAINAAFFAVCFGVSRPVVAATQFTAYMALMNLGVALAQGQAGRIELELGTRGAWILAATIQLSVVALMPLTRLKGSKTRFSS